MASTTTFIKLDRNILRWGWYTNPNTFRVFIHLLLTANVTDRKFEEITIKRGDARTSYEKLATELGISIQQVRTAISHLKSTGEITSYRNSKYQVFTVVKYDEYQGKHYSDINNQSTFNQQDINSQSTFNQQQLNNNNKYNNKNNYNNSREISSDFDVNDFFRVSVESTMRKAQKMCEEENASSL